VKSATTVFLLLLAGCQTATLQTDDGRVLNADYARDAYCGNSPIAMAGDAEIIAAWGKATGVECRE